MPDDAQLLHRYVHEGDEAAFTELAQRHLSLVYFAALRRVGGDRHLADDVTQMVFIDLAAKAHTLMKRPSLVGWLYTSTRFAASHAVRTDRRRRTHEEAAGAQSEIDGTPEPAWHQFRPVIDAAMDELSESDREAVLLRFFEARPLAEVGARFSLSADAARMRVERALERLRGKLAQRGIRSTTAALATVIAGQAGMAAPAGLLSQTVTSAMASVATGVAATHTIAQGLGTTVWLSGKILVPALALLIGAAYYFAPDFNPPPASTTMAETITAVETLPPPQAPAAPVALPTPTEAPALSAASSSPSTPIFAASAVGTAPDPASPPALPDIEFKTLTVPQQRMLKRLWEHEKVSPNVGPQRWGFKVAPEAPNFIDFIAAASTLRPLGLIGVGPRNGIVFLTPLGVAYCRANAKDVDAVELPPSRVVPLNPPEKTPSPRTP